MKNADFKLLAAVVEACKHFSTGDEISCWKFKKKTLTKVMLILKKNVKWHREEINEQATEGNPILSESNSNYYRFVALTSHLSSFSKCIFATDNYMIIIAKIPHIKSHGSLQGKQ